MKLILQLRCKLGIKLHQIPFTQYDSEDEVVEINQDIQYILQNTSLNSKYNTTLKAVCFDVSDCDARRNNLYEFDYILHRINPIIDIIEENCTSSITIPKILNIKSELLNNSKINDLIRNINSDDKESFFNVVLAMSADETASSYDSITPAPNFYKASGLDIQIDDIQCLTGDCLIDAL